ncbi:hypothetical protein, partial [Kitasatospora sp. NPDC059673]|uniref:hypothetical protein n=1 Tax=Kitasatospora sp. NPDC059673 TaxID=3346901 RepID=UPI00369EA323
MTATATATAAYAGPTGPGGAAPRPALRREPICTQRDFVATTTAAHSRSRQDGPADPGPAFRLELGCTQRDFLTATAAHSRSRQDGPAEPQRRPAPGLELGTPAPDFANPSEARRMAATAAARPAAPVPALHLELGRAQHEFGAPAPDVADAPGARRALATVAAAYAWQPELGRAQSDVDTSAPAPATAAHVRSAELGRAQRYVGIPAPDFVDGPEVRRMAAPVPALQLELGRAQHEFGAPAPDVADAPGARRAPATVAAAHARQPELGRAQSDVDTSAPAPATAAHVRSAEPGRAQRYVGIPAPDFVDGPEACRMAAARPAGSGGSEPGSAQQLEVGCAQRDFGSAATACSRSRQGGPAEPQRRPVAPASQLELGALASDVANGCGARRMTATVAAAYARQPELRCAQ